MKCLDEIRHLHKTSEALGIADVSVKTSEAVPRSGRFLASAKHEAELKQAKRCHEVAGFLRVQSTKQS